MNLGTSYVNEMDYGNALRALQEWLHHNPMFHGMEVEDDPFSDGSKLDRLMQVRTSVPAS